jgi:hypothetical protein
LDDIGGGRRTGVIGRLRKALSAALGRGSASGTESDAHAGADTDAGRRIEAARRRLKRAIPPRED